MMTNPYVVIEDIKGRLPKKELNKFKHKKKLKREYLIYIL